MKVVRTPQELRALCDERRTQGARVGFVPTMGALHEGHVSLVDAVREAGADFRCVSIFVNPTQFGPGEDLDKYPRTFEQDCERCEARGVDVVFAPSAGTMYPPAASTVVEVEGLTARLEGAFRPSHFRGVTTIVTKLLSAVGPCVAAFGRKDYQQLKVLCRMVEDLLLPVDMLGAPIVRDADGLALSSRNRYLAADERRRALSLVRGLRAAHDAFTAGERQPETLQRLALSEVEAGCDRVDYVATVDPDDLSPVQARAERIALLVAAHLGSTRLIDNVELGLDPRP